MEGPNISVLIIVKTDTAHEYQRHTALYYLLLWPDQNMCTANSSKIVT